MTNVAVHSISSEPAPAVTVKDHVRKGGRGHTSCSRKTFTFRSRMKKSHPSRLNRRLEARFSQLQLRAAEELIAEVGAAFLCAEFSIDGTVPHAGYIEHYPQLLEDDPKAIFTAAARAHAAVDFLRHQDPGRACNQSSDNIEITCHRCHRVLAHVGVGVRTHR